MSKKTLLSKETDILDVIGSTEYVSVGKISKVPAKIDTGADSSAIWASDIVVEKDGTLSYKLFAPSCPYYTGDTIESKEYSVSIVRSSNGHEQIRYKVVLPLKICGNTIKTSLTLADRSRNIFPILIGRRTISGKFLVDVSKKEVKLPTRKRTKRRLNEELEKNPYKFYKKYVKKDK